MATTLAEIDINASDRYLQFTGKDAAVLRRAAKKLASSVGEALIVFVDEDGVRALATT